MRKPFTSMIVVTLTLSALVVSASAQSNFDQGNLKNHVTKQAAVVKDILNPTTENQQKIKERSEAITEQVKTKANEVKQQFKTEFTEQKKDLQQQKDALIKQKEELEAQYQKLLSSKDTSAEAFLKQISALDQQINGLQSQIKTAINERFMVTKAMYSATELAQFESASSLITKMYADAKTLGAGSVTVNNNIVKFDAPPYIKGGNTLVPLRAISEQLGAKVSWNEGTQTVTISKGETILEFKVNSKTVLVNGVPTEISSPATVTSGRTYLPLRFLAEALNFDVAWDGDNQIIDINNETTPNADTSSNNATSTVSPVPTN